MSQHNNTLKHKNASPYVKCIFDVSASSLAKKDFFTRTSDPYIVIDLPDQAFAAARLKDNSKLLSKVFGVSFDVGSIGGAALGASLIGTAVAPAAVAAAATTLTAAALQFTYKQVRKTHPKREDCQEVYVSEVIKRNLCPSFQQFEITFHESFTSRSDAELIFSCWDWDRASASDLIGECVVNLTTLFKNNKAVPFELTDKHGKNGGTLYVRAYTDEPHTSTTSLGASQ